jgi:hypothetical protein
VPLGAQPFENRHVRGNLDGFAARADPDGEWFVLGRARTLAGTEILEMYGGGRPMAGHVADRVHQCRSLDAPTTQSIKRRKLSQYFVFRVDLAGPNDRVPALPGAEKALFEADARR